MTSTVMIIIAVAATLIVSVPVSAVVAINIKKKDADSKLGNATKKAREILDDAITESENKKRETILEAKEEALKIKNDIEKEVKERRQEISSLEKRNLNREEALDRKQNAIEKKESDLKALEKSIQDKEIKVDELNARRIRELEKVANFTSEQAKQELLKSVEEELEFDKAKLIKQYEQDLKEETDKIAKEYIITAIQRCAADYATENTVSTVELPNDEMKGRIIGREGRNIRTLEMLTGVEVIIDDTPEAVVLSSFDPIRRQIAHSALRKLVVDGRIHPTRIEESVEKAKQEIAMKIKQEGEQAVLQAQVTGIHPELVRLLGRMYFRTSYGQNALQHSLEVAELSGLLAAEMGEDETIARRAGLLHDIGKSIDHEVEGSHVEVGSQLCKKYNENDIVIDAVESHHGDKEAKSLIACIVQAADAISAARPGARRETLEAYINRLKQLEEIADKFNGVDKSFAIQAGREIRVIVKPEMINDSEMVILARDITKEIEDKLNYPGQVKVSVIRESRATEYAK